MAGRLNKMIELRAVPVADLKNARRENCCSSTVVPPMNSYSCEPQFTAQTF